MTNFISEKKTSITQVRWSGMRKVDNSKCDICYDQAEGSACAQIYPSEALAFVPVEGMRI